RASKALALLQDRDPNAGSAILSGFNRDTWTGAKIGGALGYMTGSGPESTFRGAEAGSLSMAAVGLAVRSARAMYRALTNADVVKDVEWLAGHRSSSSEYAIRLGRVLATISSLHATDGPSQPAAA